MVLEDLQIDLLEPRLEKPGLPEPCQVVDAVAAAQILYGRILPVGRIGSEYGRRTRTEILGRGQHPWLPGAGERSNRRIAAPHTGRGRIGAIEGLAGAVALSERDHGSPDVLPPVQSTEDIAGECHASHHPRSR